MKFKSKVLQAIRRMCYGYFFVLLLVREPLTLLSQFALRRNGGLKGNYQLHRLYEIRKLLLNRNPKSGIEFGSGASTVLFAKYIKNFISIEESFDWRDHYINNLRFIKFLQPSRYSRICKSIYMADRTEYCDSKGELVCSYNLPVEIKQQNYEIAYIDGPTNWVQGNTAKFDSIRDPFKLLPNISVCDLVHLPTTILVDGRRSTVSYLLDLGSIQNYNISLKGEYYANQQFFPYHTRFESPIKKN